MAKKRTTAATKRLRAAANTKNLEFLTNSAEQNEEQTIRPALPQPTAPAAVQNKRIRPAVKQPTAAVQNKRIRPALQAVQNQRIRPALAAVQNQPIRPVKGSVKKPAKSVHPEDDSSAALESSVLGSLGLQNVKTAMQVRDIQMELFKDWDEPDIDCDQPEPPRVTATAKAAITRKEATDPKYLGTTQYMQKKLAIAVPTTTQAAGVVRAERAASFVEDWDDLDMIDFDQSEPLCVSATAQASIARKEPNDLGTGNNMRKTSKISVPTMTQATGVKHTTEVSIGKKKTTDPKDPGSGRYTQKKSAILVPTMSRSAGVVHPEQVSQPKEQGAIRNIHRKYAIPVPTLSRSAGGVRSEQNVIDVSPVTNAQMVDVRMEFLPNWKRAPVQTPNKQPREVVGAGRKRPLALTDYSSLPASTDDDEEEEDAESETDECYCGQQPRIDKLVKEIQTLKNRVKRLKQENKDANNRTIRLTDTLNSKVLGDPHNSHFTEIEGYPSREQLSAFSDLSLKSDYPFMKLLMQELWPEGFVNRTVTGRSSNNPFGRPSKSGIKPRSELPAQRKIPLEPEKVKYCEDRLMEHRLYRGDFPTVAKAVAAGAKKLMKSVLSYYGTKCTMEEEHL